MSRINAQRCDLHAFKAPSPDELDHDFFWRYVRRLPERGRIVIFNRSYHEEVLVARAQQSRRPSDRPHQVVVWAMRPAG